MLEFAKLSALRWLRGRPFGVHFVGTPEVRLILSSGSLHDNSGEYVFTGRSLIAPVSSSGDKGGPFLKNLRVRKIM